MTCVDFSKAMSGLIYSVTLYMLGMLGMCQLVVRPAFIFYFSGQRAGCLEALAYQRGLG